MTKMDSLKIAESLRHAETCLQSEKQRLYDEIRNYPTPIAGCDQQFNYLLEQQAQIIAELARVRAALRSLAP